jgi:hypothetical protein
LERPFDIAGQEEGYEATAPPPAAATELKKASPIVTCSSKPLESVPHCRLVNRKEEMVPVETIKGRPSIYLPHRW